MKIELLSPAKNKEVGMAAIDHGADAVYIGGPSFGAREKVSNSINDIEELCRHAHLFGAKVYVTLNTILFDNELEPARKIAYNCWNAGVDALIVQDMALAQMDMPPIPLHASTQCHNNTVEKIQFLEKIGFRQVILAREMNIQQIKEIRSKTTIPLEYFVHGALCVCYSGQCYLSQVIGNRSANRGACAQPCRLAWNLEDENGRTLIKNRHLLSLKDLNNSNNLKELMDAGITSFKIEGRLKDIDYVKNVTAFYRRKIDEILENQTINYSFEPDLAKSFNRGFTDYFIHGRQKGIDSPFTPKSMGELVGTVKKVSRNSIEIDGNQSFHNGDGLCFLDKDNELAGFFVNNVEGKTITPSSMREIQIGTKIYRNFDKAWQKQVEQSKGNRKINISLILSDYEKGFRLSANVFGLENVVETFMETEKIIAENVEKSFENIRRKAIQWGDTPFNVIDLKINLSEPFFIPTSTLGALKRALVEKLTSYLIEFHDNERQSNACEISDDPSVKYPVSELSYLGNVVNSQAHKFYENHGVVSIQDGLEKAMPEGEITAMTTKHCIRYCNGMCSKETGVKAKPLYLKNDKGTFRLEFDCGKCEMRVVFV